jgi:phage shock protein C
MGLRSHDPPGCPETLCRIVIGGNMQEQNWLRRLSKAKDDQWIGGVCGGLGKHTPVPSWTWRVLFSLLFFCFGTGLLIYVLLWVFMPKEP